MRRPQQELLPNYWGFFAHAQRPGDSTCSRLRKLNLDAPSPTLLNLQDRTVRRRTERTMLPLRVIVVWKRELSFFICFVNHSLGT
jgi:hypothetical protein